VLSSVVNVATIIGAAPRVAARQSLTVEDRRTGPELPHSNLTVGNLANERAHTRAMKACLIAWAEALLQGERQLSLEKLSVKDVHTIATAILSPAVLAGDASWSSVASCISEAAAHDVDCSAATPEQLIVCLEVLLRFSVSEVCTERFTFISAIMGLSAADQEGLKQILEQQLPGQGNAALPFTPASPTNVESSSRELDDDELDLWLSPTKGSTSTAALTAAAAAQVALGALHTSTSSSSGSSSGSSSDTVAAVMATEAVQRELALLQQEHAAALHREAAAVAAAGELRRQLEGAAMHAELRLIEAEGDLERSHGGTVQALTERLRRSEEQCSQLSAVQAEVRIRCCACCCSLLTSWSIT
jgi:hypothetical protein